ncbi:MAG: precorrin-6y C5,15-methyltransferase (decarboxylating) subunit CbiE [Nitrospirota bacterium]|nr:precorrin-6y C5,15-methyltransferase (decarboxylating) subunit CbiE [Nitrospirota bacterium]
MAKEIYLIGVGPDGRESLSARALEMLKECHLIVGGKRVISQFEDLDIPTYAMSANLRQLVDVVGHAEKAVKAGEPVVIEPSIGDDEDDMEGEDEGSDEESASGEDEAPREGGRRRGRRRPSPRNRGRGRGRGQSADGESGGSGGSEGDGGGNGGNGGGEGGGQPKATTIDAPSDSQSMTVQVDDDSAEPDSDGTDQATAVADEAGTESATAKVEPEAAPEQAEARTDAPDDGGEESESTPEDAPRQDDAEARTDTEAPAGEAEVSASDNALDLLTDSGAAEGSREAAEEKDSGPVCRVAILASGDPNFYGLSKFLLERFKKEELTIIPHVSAMQLAFAAIKEPMNDAAITSSSGRNVDRLVRVVRQNARIGIFTDKRRSTRAVARLLLKNKIEAQCYVCQDLGTARERIVMGSLEEIGKKNFSPLSIMILFKQAVEEPEPKEVSEKRAEPKKKEREPQRPNLKDLPPASQVPKYELVTSLGIPDELLSVRPENIMRAEMRVIVLSKLRIQEKSRMWDVGAGCGALSVEAARVAHGGEVFAVERDFAQVRNIYENIKTFASTNLTVIEGDVEEMASRLPEPDRVFIGGCGGHMKNVMETCLKRLKRGGIMCINAATLDALTEVQQVLKEQRLKHDMVIVNISKTVERGGVEYFEGLNPGYLITTVKD